MDPYKNVDLNRLTLSNLTYLIQALNAELDSGKHDGITLKDVKDAMDEKRVFPLLLARVKEIDLSLFKEKPQAVAEYEEELHAIHGGYAGDEGRKWGVYKKGLALLLAWTCEIVKHGWKEYPRKEAKTIRPG